MTCLSWESNLICGQQKVTLVSTSRFAFKSGFLLGVIGFVSGVVGPMIITPDANQGPMLGIFITGPLGFAIGLAGGE
jgi:hypothetical protein